MPILSKRDRSATVRYAMDRIEEALAQVWMREFCAANNISVLAIRGADNRPEISKQRIKVALYLCGRGVARWAVASVMHRHYDMIRYYVKPSLRAWRKEKNRRNTERIRRASGIKSKHGVDMVI